MSTTRSPVADDLRYTDALTMADSVMAYRLTVKEVAHEFGIYDHMPKPVAGVNGSGITRTSRCSRATATRSSTRATPTICPRPRRPISRERCATRQRSP